MGSQSILFAIALTCPTDIDRSHRLAAARRADVQRGAMVRCAHGEQPDGEPTRVELEQTLRAL
jgi:hypothetical protein